MKPTKCRACGQEILLVKTAKGVTIPVDIEAQYYRPYGSGKNLYVEPNWETFRGDPCSLDLPAAKLGYISHFDTCPNPRMRKGKRARKADGGTDE